MEDVERLELRLANMRSASPILSALRTISLGRWQAALRQHRLIAAYRDELRLLLQSLRPLVQPPDAALEAPPTRVLLIAVGSERGLCGRFSGDVIDQALAMRRAYADAGIAVRMTGLGAQIDRYTRRRKITVDITRLNASRLPTAEDALRLIRDGLDEYERGELDAVLMVYNESVGAGKLQTTSRQIIPVEFDVETEGKQSDFPDDPIVETPPAALYTQVLVQFAALTALDVLLQSAAAEYITRFHLMDSASQNAERLVEELSTAMQDVHRQTITREVQTLAVSAGLVSSRQRS